jgi:four helix bundle protein
MDNRRFLDIDDVTAYEIAFELSNYVWDVVINWDWFAKKTIGVQFVTSADSISANIAEGYGRFHKKDKIKFYHYSRGSAIEALDWTIKAYGRKLLSADQFQYISQGLQKLPKEINNLIKYTNLKLKI